MRSSLSPLAASFPLLALAACGASPAATDMGPPPDPGHPHFQAAAAAELQGIGIDKYRGKAVIASEMQVGPVTSVTFDPASGPMCLFGAAYMAHFEPTGSDKLLIFLGGGGACWTGFCEATPLPDTSILPLGPLHVEVQDNPFHGYNVLYLPYCDGSVFSGDNDVPDPSGIRYFHGRKNLAAGMDLLDRLGPIHSVTVAGVSAGAYGTLVTTAAARLRYPNADLTVWDDSGPYLQNLALTDDVNARIHDWRYDEILPPSCTECAAGHGQLISFMSWLLAHDDQLEIGLLSYYEDGVIGGTFNKLDGPSYKALLLSETGKLHDAFPDRANRFFIEGDAHVLTLEWPDFEKVDGVSIKDFASGLLNGGASWRDLLAP